MIPNLSEARNLLYLHTKKEALLSHAQDVEVVMAHFAALFGEDQDYWSAVGLLHDLDYEKYPEQHCKKTREILESLGYEEAFIRAIESHGYGICTEVMPEKKMEKVLYAIDELTGLIHAAALMRPSKNLQNMELKSLKKKFKSPSFAAKVNRETIIKGAEMLSMDLDELMKECLSAMQSAEENEK